MLLAWQDRRWVTWSCPLCVSSKSASIDVCTKMQRYIDGEWRKRIKESELKEEIEKEKIMMMVKEWSGKRKKEVKEVKFQETQTGSPERRPMALWGHCQSPTGYYMVSYIEAVPSQIYQHFLIDRIFSVIYVIFIVESLTSLFIKIRLILC